MRAEEIREMSGDDIKHLDWKVFGRTDKLQLKQFRIFQFEQLQFEQLVKFEFQRDRGDRCGRCRHRRGRRGHLEHRERLHRANQPEHPAGAGHL